MNAKMPRGDGRMQGNPGRGWPIPSVWESSEASEQEQEEERIYPNSRTGDSRTKTTRVGRGGGSPPLTFSNSFGIPEVQLDRLPSISYTSKSEASSKQEQESLAASRRDSVWEEGARGYLMPVPIKVMIFIDGTWLFYSFFSRGQSRCPFIKKFGTNWIEDFSIDWAELQAFIRETLQRHLPGRFVDIMRVIVFGSVRSGTHPSSLRVRMFQEMDKSNFEVHLLTHTGGQEKCVDISLGATMRCWRGRW